MTEEATAGRWLELAVTARKTTSAPRNASGDSTSCSKGRSGPVSQAAYAKFQASKGEVADGFITLDDLAEEIARPKEMQDVDAERVTRDEVRERVRVSLVAERALRERGEAMFAPIAERVHHREVVEREQERLVLGGCHGRQRRRKAFHRRMPNATAGAGQ